MRFFDTNILVYAAKCQCHEIVTEELNDGQLYRGMKAVNPFLEKNA